MIGLWWLNHVQDVLAAASDEQLRAVQDSAAEEIKRRATMIPRVVKCRRKRAVERVAKLLVQGMPLSVPKEESAPKEQEL